MNSLVFPFCLKLERNLENLAELCSRLQHILSVDFALCCSLVHPRFARTKLSASPCWGGMRWREGHGHVGDSRLIWWPQQTPERPDNLCYLLIIHYRNHRKNAPATQTCLLIPCRVSGSNAAPRADHGEDQFTGHNRVLEQRQYLAAHVEGSKLFPLLVNIVVVGLLVNSVVDRESQETCTPLPSPQTQSPSLWSFDWHAWVGIWFKNGFGTIFCLGCSTSSLNVSVGPPLYFAWLL